MWGTQVRQRPQVADLRRAGGAEFCDHPPGTMLPWILRRPLTWLELWAIMHLGALSGVQREFKQQGSPAESGVRYAGI